MNQNHNTHSGAYKISDAVATCPNCSHKFFTAEQKADIIGEVIQASTSLVVGWMMLHVSVTILHQYGAMSSISTALQTFLLYITIILLWSALPILQYMRLFPTWLACTYALFAVFAPFELTIIFFTVWGGV